jgi:hypothetical protein
VLAPAVPTPRQSLRLSITPPRRVPELGRSVSAAIESMHSSNDHWCANRRCGALEGFTGCLGAATTRIAKEYIIFETHSEPIERERVYCYELYHQLRLAWDKRLSRAAMNPILDQFRINGEVDKIGHAAFCGPLAGAKPDIIVHSPGSMDRNLVAMEVKRASARTGDMVKDIEKLESMISLAHYQRGIFLIFGAFDPGELIRSLTPTQQQLIQNSKIQIWHHSAAGNQATVIAGDCQHCHAKHWGACGYGRCYLTLPRNIRTEQNADGNPH